MARVERRQFGRRQDNAHGWLVVEGRPRIPCVVRDISLNGARIEAEAANWLPFRFRLVVESRGINVLCEIRHQQPNSVGVMFVHQEAMAEAVGMATVEERQRWLAKR